jgi:hypothetical protein
LTYGAGDHAVTFLPGRRVLPALAALPVLGLRHGGESEYHCDDEQCDPDVPHILSSFSLEPKSPE